MKQARLLLGIIFEASSLIDIEGNGQVFLSDQDVAVLNEELAKEGFEERLEKHTRTSLCGWTN